uniref:Uncharacterized protein n=1 Tax=Corethron hystrix TaxID=216773 RepID=A0A7S1FTL1_9STRA
MSNTVSRKGRADREGRNIRQKQQTAASVLFSASKKTEKETEIIDIVSDEEGDESIPETNKVSREVINIDDSIPKAKEYYRIYCDLDGVLVDFEKGVRNLSGGRGPSDMSTRRMWSIVAKDDSFYENLPWTPDGRTLWAAILPLQPDILTGVPMTIKSRAQKASWCKRELPSVLLDSKNGYLNGVVLNVNHVDYAGRTKSREHGIVTGNRAKKDWSSALDATRLNGPSEIVVNVLTCWSKNKHCESGANCVLIDDRLDLKEAWIKKGGIFIHHISTKKTLLELKALNIL